MYFYVIFLFKEFCSSFCKSKDYESKKKHVDPDSYVIDYGTNDTTLVIGKFIIKYFLCKNDYS